MDTHVPTYDDSGTSCSCGTMPHTTRTYEDAYLDVIVHLLQVIREKEMVGT